MAKKPTAKKTTSTTSRSKKIDKAIIGQQTEVTGATVEAREDGSAIRTYPNGKIERINVDGSLTVLKAGSNRVVAVTEEYEAEQEQLSKKSSKQLLDQLDEAVHKEYHSKGRKPDAVMTLLIELAKKK